jgi:hypothetical protein
VSESRRSLGPVIAYMLTLLGLVLGGIWLWSAVHTTPAPRSVRESQVQPAPTASTSPSSEEFSATEHQALEEILRRKAVEGKH